MAFSKEPRTAEPVMEAVKADMPIKDFVLALRDRRGILKRGPKSKSLRYFWSCDDEDWFYMCGFSVGLKKKIAVDGMWIRKDVESFLQDKKKEGYEFFLEKK